ncbi:MAG: hypothetical protein MUF64_02880 [Polyangiaceae bacterium]|jgi:nucleoside phosphorylase|nr:hypothetical protein [Polyangiaceae bacterium]
MSTGHKDGELADVLIVTAVKDEWEAVLAVDTGAVPGSAWQKHSSDGPEVVFRDFTTENATLRIAVIQSFGMGREHAAIAAAPLLERHPEIRCLAMCGVCAGKRGDVALGDVIVADRTWPYDAGKWNVSVDEQGQRIEHFQGDMEPYRIHPPEWRQQAERFQPDPAASWIGTRPRSYEEQGDWVLERLALDENPLTHPERRTKCPDWRQVLEQLWKVQRLEDGEINLTEVGRRHIRRRMTLEPDGLQANTPFKVVVGPVASGAPVVQDPTIFDRLAETAGMRKVVGLEMETSAILALAYLQKVPFAIVMKGVMDHADVFKSDNMKAFAAQASAECLVEFLRKQFPSGLKDRKDDPLGHAGDWAVLDARSAREVALIRDSIADRVRLPREVQVTEVINSLAGDAQVALLGPSGVGKSAIAKATFERRRANGEKTLWVDTTSLDRAVDFGAFETSLQLQHPVAELLSKETNVDPLIIIDGLDRLYSDQAFRNVASLLRAASGEPPQKRWRVLAVCQSQEWPRVLEALYRAGAALNHWHLHEAKAPRLADLQPVQEAIPTLSRLLLQPRVGVLLTNLKLLDLVVRRLDSGTQIDASTWVGESSVAEWFWCAEIDRGQDRLARGQFARGLAQVQADQLVASVSVDALEVSSLGAAHSLVADQLLVQMPGDRLAFAHDLYGDWARLRILLNNRADLASFLQNRHESPLWHRAIRLFGIHVLEHENEVAEWKTLISSFDSGNLTIIRDLLLEAPAFAMNAGLLLDSIFPNLIAGGGALLQRLLTRFLAFATVPNEQIQEIARAVGMDANAARASFRRPHWPYWLDVIAVLHAHRSDVVRTAACETARLVEMWLEFAPPRSTRRREAAELAVMLGQKAVDSRDGYREKGERGRFYKCSLMAAPERPDDVALIARTAAERIPRSTISSDDPMPPRPRARSMFSTGVIRGPWPDGPLACVDEEFQNVVLDTPAILHLYRVNSAVAREVILAALIEAPSEEYWGESRLHDREFYLVSRHKWHPALYTQGPFLGCLRENFPEGLELIMRLLDFATERASERAELQRREWRAQAIADGHSEADVDLAMTAAPRRRLALWSDGTDALIFEGDALMYGWSSGLGNPPDAVEAALMALEQYFYLRLDAGDDIAESVAAVLARSRSVAALGVLCDVGKRQPHLFNGPLRALLSAPEIYSWEIKKLVNRRTHLMIGAGMRGQPFVKLAQQFHGLEHRNLDLRCVAAERLLKSEEMQSFFFSVREWWKKRREDGEQLPDIAEQLDIWLDPTNYEMREDQTRGLVIVNAALERAQAERAPEHQALNDRMLVTNFPLHCRTLLDERRVQTDVQLDKLWQTWEHIRELAKAGPALPGGEERFGDEYINAVLGGITVFLWCEEWLSQDANRRPEVEGALEAILNGECPERDGFHSEQDVSTWTWDCFLAETAAMLWVRAPRDARWRRLVAQMVFADKYITVRLLFSRCAEHRAALGDDFERLRRLVIDWAHVRDRARALRSLQQTSLSVDERLRERLQAEVATWSEQAISSFVEGTLAPLRIDWNLFDAESRFAEIDVLLRRRPGFRLMDFHLVHCSHEWMPLPDSAQSPKERTGIIQFWRVALDVVAARPRTDLQRRDHQYPHEDEAWVLENVAALVLQLRAAENPELFWAAIVDLHSEAHDWPENFLNALHRRALSSEPTPATYAPLVRAIVQRAFSDIEGERRWPWHEEVWDALLGINSWGSELWVDRHADLVLSIRDVVSLWMEKAPQQGRRLGGFARWLSRSAAAAIRLDTLAWFLGLLQVDEARSVSHDEDAEDGVAELLNVVWDQDQNRLRSAPKSFAAFRGLLAWLVERQNALGLELQGRIGGLT